MVADTLESGINDSLIIVIVAGTMSRQLKLVSVCSGIMVVAI